MVKMYKCLLICFCVVASTHAQNQYSYSVDLTKVENDQLTVELLCPSINKKQVQFYFPKIVPGTYMNSNYGKYVHNIVATNKNGKALPISQTSDNSWLIQKANTLYKISYQVEDTWDATIKNKVYSMCGTSFEANKNFVLNTPGIFGYLEGLKNIPFHLTFKKPVGFYGASGLKSTLSSIETDEFICTDADHLYDSPIMYCLPDTTSIKVGNTDVLIAVYSPHRLATSAFIADSLKRFLNGARDYLGGKLPVDRYAFIFYFNGEQPELESSGAWEHSYSSFYSLTEEPQKEAIHYWVDIAAHEFFHIVTPLTISSKEVKQFNFNETVLSKHLWLYEGSTEYYSQNMQAWYGLTTPEQFLENLSNKIGYSREMMNDTLPFTELSLESAGKYQDQYGNVYMKGAMINACLDLYLLKLSNAQYGLRQLKHDLGLTFGKDKYFEDDSLFNIITQLSFPEIGEFLNRYVSGNSPLPYEKFFSFAGVDYLKTEKYKDFTLGGLDLQQGENNEVKIGIKKLNEMGRKMNYKEGDILYSIGDSVVTYANLNQRINYNFQKLKEGDTLRVKVKRINGSGIAEIISLSAPTIKIEKERKHVLRFMENPSPSQLKIRNTWLNDHVPSIATITASPNDVSTIDQITKALYDVISGPAGPRNWDRFKSLFHADAYMGAISEKKTLQKFTPAQYVRMNGPFFLKNSFTEKEIGRTVNQFGNIAQVFTSYEYTLENPPTKQRGINSIELVKENNRWYIMSITWDEEKKDQPIPANYLILKP